MMRRKRIERSNRHEASARRIATWAIVALCFAGMRAPRAAWGAPPPLLAPYIALGVPFIPNSIEIADVNADGLLDVVVLNDWAPLSYSPGPAVQLCLGVGDGTFAPPRTYEIANSGGRIALGRLDFDPYLDLVVTAGSEVRVMMDTEHGEFAAPVGYPAAGATDLAIADVLGDSRREVIALVPAAGEIRLWSANNATGVLDAPIAVATLPSPGMMIVANLDGDLKGDVLVANPNDRTVSVFLGSGTAFGAHVEVPMEGAPRRIGAGDIDGDGVEDLIVFLDAPHRMLTFAGDGAGGFHQPTWTVMPFVPAGFGIEDFDGDGRRDIVVVQTESAPLVLFGRGSGYFEPPVAALPITNTFAVGTGDFSSDGRGDFVVGHMEFPGVSHWLAVTTGNSNRTFGHDARVTAAGGVGDLATGDLDGDGTVDIVATCPKLDLVSVFLGAGHGVFARADLEVGGQPNSVAVADLDGDGLDDLAVALEERNRIAVFRGGPNGSLARLPDVETGRRPLALAAAALDGDPHLDLVCAGWTDHAVFLHRGRGDGTFEPATQITFVGPVEFVGVGDFDRDPYLDLVVSEGGSYGYARVMMGLGDGTFVPGPAQLLEDNHPSWAAIAALGDGTPDVVYTIPVVCARFHCADSHGFWVLAGNGAGGVSSSAFHEAGVKPKAGAVGDIDHDGVTDLAIVNSGSSSVTLLLASTTRFPAARFDFGVWPSPGAAAVADVNGDGWNDLLVASEASGQISFLMGVGGLVDVAEVEAPIGLALGAPRPNPSSGDVSWTLRLPVSARTRVAVYDGAGRLVRTLHDGTLHAGTHPMRWAGTTDHGRRVPTGVYFVAATVEGTRVSRRIARMN